MSQSSHLPYLFETDLQVKTSQLTNSKTPAFRRARPSWPPPLGSYSRFSDEHPGPILIVAGDFPNSAKNGKKEDLEATQRATVFCLLPQLPNEWFFDLKVMLAWWERIKILK